LVAFFFLPWALPYLGLDVSVLYYLLCLFPPNKAGELCVISLRMNGKAPALGLLKDSKCKSYSYAQLQSDWLIVIIVYFGSSNFFDLLHLLLVMKLSTILCSRRISDINTHSLYQEDVRYILISLYALILFFLIQITSFG
jgi:hypothetical protein